MKGLLLAAGYILGTMIPALLAVQLDQPALLISTVAVFWIYFRMMTSPDVIMRCPRCRTGVRPTIIEGPYTRTWICPHCRTTLKDKRD